MCESRHRFPVGCRTAIGHPAVRRGRCVGGRTLGSLLIALLATQIGLLCAQSRCDGQERPARQKPAAATKASGKKAATNDGADPQASASLVLKGIVVDEQEQPVAGVKVESISHRERSATVSAKDGSFSVTVENVRNTRLLLFATSSGDRLASFEGPVNKLPAEIRLALHPARVVVASVVDGDQRPVTGAKLGAITQYFMSVGGAVSDANGKARLLVPKDTQLQFVYAVKPDVGLDYFTYKSREAGAAPENPLALAPDHDQPLPFVLNGTRTVTVRVADDRDQPLANLSVSAWYFEKPGKGGYLHLGTAPEFQSSTDREGRAVFRTIPADNVGKVTFWARHEDYFTPERVEFDPAAAVRELNATLLPLVPVSGTVTLEDGRPAVGAQITVAGDGYTIDGFHGATRAGKDGTFTIRVNPDHFCMFVARLGRQVSRIETRVVRAGEPLEGIRLSLQDATRIYGRVTIGKQNQPVAGQHIQLYVEPKPDYYQLPKAERLPNPRDDRRGISPRITQNVQTDADGRYEFFAGPGKYYMIRFNATGKAPQFEIADEKEHEVNFHDDGPSVIDFQAQVVRETAQKRGVAETQVEFAGIESSAVPWRVSGDKQGNLRVQRTPCEMLVFSETPGGLLAGITKIEPEAATGEVALAPTASVRARLVNATTGAPLSGIEIECSILVKHSNERTFSYRFGSSAQTDAAGRFVARRVVPGWEYQIKLVAQRGADGSARQWGPVGVVTAERAECIDLGDIQIATHPVEPLEGLIGRAFQSPDTHVLRFERAAADAQFAQQRLLLLLAGKETPPVHQFFALFFDRAGNSTLRDDFVEALSHFRILAVDPSLIESDPHARAWAERLKITSPAANEARFLVFESDGRIAAQSGVAELSTAGQLALKPLTAFLAKSAAPVPDAEKIFAAALAQAQREDKRVLLVQNERYSNSYMLLTRWLEASRDLIARDYVVVTVSARDANGEKLLTTLRGDSKPGPCLAICDAAGKTLATSDGPTGNVAYPVDAAGTGHFDHMFRQTARRLTDADLQKLIKRLE